MCLPTTPPIPTTHFTPPYLPSLAGSLTSLLLFFSFSLIHSFLLLYPLSLVLPHHYHHHFHHHFQTRSRENSWESISTFTSFFEIKISNIFGGFYTFVWGYFYLSFKMIPMWFMSIGSDIYVFVCMCFVLVELFDEWVYGLC